MIPFYPFGERGTYLTGHPLKNVLLKLKEGALREGGYFTKDGSY